MRTRRKWVMRRVERMKRSFILWLTENKVPPELHPEIGEVTKRGFALVFHGIARELSFCVNKMEQRHSEVLVMVHFHDTFWDGLLDPEVIEVRKGGYFTCDLCRREEKTKRFLSRDQLYADHLWKPFWEWVQENFHPDKMVCLFQTEDGGITWAEIISKNDIAKYSPRDTFVHAFPVITDGII